MTLSRSLLAVLLLAAAAPAQNPQPGNWTGQLVVGKKPNKQVKFGDNPDGKQVYFEFKGNYPQRVRDDRDGWLRLFDGHREGWALKDDFVLSRDAVAYFTDRIRANPRDAFAWNARGIAHGDRGDHDAAIRDFTECIRLEPTSAKAHNARGTEWAAKRDHDAAIKDYTEAIKLDPNYALAFTNRAIAWRGKRDYDAAIKEYTEAIRLNPEYAPAYHGRGFAWNAKRDHDAAIKDYTEAIRLDPKDAAAFDNRGDAWSGKKDYDAAIKDYSEAIRLDPTRAFYYVDRATARNNKGEYDAAIKDFDEAIRLDPRYAGAHFGRSVSLFLKQSPESVAGFRRVLEIEGGQGGASPFAVILGHLAARANKDETAARLFLTSPAASLGKDWPLPIVEYLRGAIDEAALLKAATDDGQQTDARCYLGYDHLLKGNADAAAAHFRWVKEKGVATRIPYTLAAAELERMEKAKK